MNRIRKKIIKGYYEDLLSGKKKFDLRLNNFTIKEGDMLELVEVDENRQLTGRKLQKKVTYVRSLNSTNFFGQLKR